MFNALKNKITNFASYMLGLDEQLKNAKNDKERVEILKNALELQSQKINELTKNKLPKLDAKILDIQNLLKK